jgi:glycosyltransferase involved in cell wall biosynthesis
MPGSTMNPARDSCELTVIVGSLDAGAHLPSCLESLQSACAGLDAEILIVDGSADSALEEVRTRFAAARFIAMPRGTLVPALWGRGLREARGKVVAFTIAQCRVEADWARTLIAGIRTGAAGVGGPLDVLPGTSATGRATFYLRYSAWLASSDGPAHEIAGDNAAYEHAALRAARNDVGEAFWEVEAHERLRELGRSLVMRSAATAWFTDDTSLSTMAARRFAHGRHSGAFRVRQGIRTRWQMVVGAPLVPLVLFARVARRVARVRGHVPRFVTSLGAFLVLATAWAVGEAIGTFTAEEQMREALRAA